MAALIKLTNPKTGGQLPWRAITIHRNSSNSISISNSLLSPSLPRGAKRSSPSASSLAGSRFFHSYHPNHNHNLRAHDVGYRRNSNASFRYSTSSTTNGYYSAAPRTLRRPWAEETTSMCVSFPKNSRSFSSSSSFWDKMKQKAEKAAKSVAKRASKTVQNTAEKATETAQKAVSKASKTVQSTAAKTLESTQKAALDARDQALKRVSETAANTKEESQRRISEAAASVTRAAQEQLSKTASTVTKSTTQNIEKSQKAISSGVEQQTKAATAKVEDLKKSSLELKDTFASTGTKVLRMFWWWSLAAIFVYGVASTLPMAIIRYTMEQKKEKYEGKSNATPSPTDTSAGTDEEETIRTEEQSYDFR